MSLEHRKMSPICAKKETIKRQLALKHTSIISDALERALYMIKEFLDV